MQFPATIRALFVLSAATMTAKPVTAQTESENARTLRRVAELTAYRNSPTFARIAELQKGIGTLNDAKELFDLHNSIDLSQEQSKLSPTNELYYLLKAEVVFVQLKNPNKEMLPIPDALEQIAGYGNLRRDEVRDPTGWLEYQVLSGMYALQKDQKAEAQSHLREFEDFTKPFNVPADIEYVSQMRQHIATGDKEAARKTFSKRLGIFFPEHFGYVTESFDNKIALMKEMAKD